MEPSNSSSRLEMETEDEVWEERCNDCLRCSNNQNCNECVFCKMNKKCEKRRCFKARKLYEDRKVREAKTAAKPKNDVKEEGEKKKRGRKKGSTKANLKYEKVEEVTNSARPTRQAIADTRRRIMVPQFSEPRQCLNPDCILETRTNSKYCSDECGLILARMRLTEVFPARIKEYFSGPRTHEERLEAKQDELKREMHDLGVSEKRLIKFIDKLHDYIAKHVHSHAVHSDEKEDETIFESCVVCGQPDVPIRRYAKHVENCWAKSEKAISFGAPEKNNEAIYCEKYDDRTKSYCKRLKSLCPEHKRPGPEHVLKVCAYPTKWEENPNQSFTIAEIIESDDPFGDKGCLNKKDACLKHCKWIPTLRGSIELEQVCLLNKMFELCNESQKCKNYLQWSRNSLMAIAHQPSSSSVDNSGSTSTQ